MAEHQPVTASMSDDDNIAGRAAHYVINAAVTR